MPQKTVLFIANSLFTITNFRMELINTLLSAGSKVVIICPTENSLDSGSNQKRLLDSLNVEVHNVDMSRNGINPWSDLKYFIKLLLLIRRLKPDVVLNYTIKPVVYGSIAAAMNKVKKIASNMTGLGYVFTDSGIKAFLIRIVLKQQIKVSLRCNDIVFFQNPDDRQLISDMIGFPNRVVVSLINGSGVNLDKFRLESGVTKVKDSFIFVGRLIKDKGIFEFLEMAERIKSSNPDTTFTIIGAYDDHPSAVSHEVIESYVDRGVVDYRGQVSNVLSVLSEHEVLVLPSYREGTPRAVLESMALGMPVITTDAPGCRETVQQGINGYLVPVKDVDALCNAVKKFLETPSLINNMGKESLKLVKCKYDVVKVNKKILNDISKLD